MSTGVSLFPGLKTHKKDYLCIRAGSITWSDYIYRSDPLWSILWELSRVSAKRCGCTYICEHLTECCGHATASCCSFWSKYKEKGTILKRLLFVFVFFEMSEPPHWKQEIVSHWGHDKRAMLPFFADLLLDGQVHKTGKQDNNKPRWCCKCRQVNIAHIPAARLWVLPCTPTEVH